MFIRIEICTNLEESKPTNETVEKTECIFSKNVYLEIPYYV